MSDKYRTTKNNWEGYICPNLVHEVKVEPVDPEEDWDDSKGELKIVNNSSDDSHSAIHISLKD